MIQRRPGIALTAAVAAAFLAVGCTSPIRSMGYEILATDPPQGSVTAQEVHPLSAGRWVHVVAVGDDAGSQVVYERGRTDRFEADWTDHRGRRRSEYWRLDDRGNLVMPASIDHGEGTITTFEPPLIVAYASLPAGASLRQTVRMRVVDDADPTQEREAGTAIQTIEYADRRRIRTLRGEYEAKRVVMQFEADLKLAKASTTTTLLVAPDRGPVVREIHETVRTFGVTIRSRRQTLVLTSSPLPPEAAAEAQPQVTDAPADAPD